MANMRTMLELLRAPTKGYGDAIVIPVILAEDYELKARLLQLVTSSQFHGFERDDPHAHIRWFNKITYMLKYKNVPNDAIKLMLFPFSLKEAARTWLEKNPLVLSIHGKISFLIINTTSYSSPSLDITALTDMVKELVLMNKANQQAFMKAVEETCVTCGSPHPYYECLATDSYTFNAFAATRTYNQGGKFTFPADFVVVDYDVDPHVPLILGRPFLRTARALVDVYGEELILRDGDEQLIFHAGSTSKHPHKHGNKSINFIDITCEDHFPQVLKFKKSNHSSSGSTTPLSDSSPSLTPFETTNLKEIEFLMHQDPSTGSNIKTINPILEKFIDKPALDYLPPPGDEDDDDDDLFDLKSDNDSTLPEDSSESSKISSLSSSPFGNEDKVFNPGIHILGRTQISNDESNDKDLKDKDLTLEDPDFFIYIF
uniref:Reverse transcriptase domain-containing protein n=1 Tax=Tanacetum cinerariifolium TaxID=118510 RepID=A0A6L2JEG1_TANCI|nr:reverse transcriptase domain-containing protein [Tanacetum cinerariifolium]